MSDRTNGEGTRERRTQKTGGKKSRKKAASRSRRRKSTRRRVISFLGFLVVLIYIPALWNWLFSVNYELGIIKTATMEIKVPIRGMMVRSETLLHSPGDGIVIPEVQYGERTPKNQQVASFINSQMQDVVNNYKEMELQILKRVVTEFDSSSGTDRQLWQTAIEKQITRMVDSTLAGNMSDAQQMRFAIDQVLESRARYMLESKSTSSSMTNDKKELERLRSSMTNSIQVLNAPLSGLVSYSMDSLEETWTPDNVKNITRGAIDAQLEASVLENKWLTPSEIAVKENEVYAKIIANEEGLIAFYVTEEQGKQISVQLQKAQLNESELLYELELSGVDERVPVQIQEVQQAEDGFSMVFGKINRYLEQTMNLRAVEGNLVMQSITGMKVPLRSLMDENTVDGTADIAVVVMNQVKIQRVQIVGRQDANAIIENLEPGNADKSVVVFDVYLVNPKNVVEGQVVDK